MNGELVFGPIAENYPTTLVAYKVMDGKVATCVKKFRATSDIVKMEFELLDKKQFNEVLEQLNM